MPAKRNKHNLKHYVLTSGMMGELLPVGCTEALPGDTFQHQASVLVRLSPMMAPLMHLVQVRLHHYFVPNRLLWDQWETFITGGPDGNDASVPPTITTLATPQPLLDYFGVPPGVAGINVLALPIYAYNMIWNEFYRDQDLAAERALTDVTLARVAWEKDYFTSARPWAMKGSEISLPLGVSAPVVVDPSANTVNDYGIWRRPSTGAAEGTGNANINAQGALIHQTNAVALQYDPNNTLYADLSTATSSTIRQLREAFALQNIQEARSRYGSRYSEYLRYAFGVRSSDARLQRPEYLGGGKQMIAFSEVLQTAEGTDPVGDMKGHGIAALRGSRYRRYFEEHGYVVSLLSVRPKAMYMNGIHRKFLRNDRNDFFQQELELIGAQEVLLNEIYADAANGNNTFGYADRYREYREEPSIVTGEFRTSTLHHWHLARDLSGAPPTLNESFVQCDPTKRVFADQVSDHLWITVNHNLIARRPVRRDPKPRIV